MFGMALLLYWIFLQQNSLKSIIENYSFGPQSLLKFLIYLLIQLRREFNNLESPKLCNYNLKVEENWTTLVIQLT
jgi:hypothetical protein